MKSVDVREGTAVHLGVRRDDAGIRNTERKTGDLVTFHPATQQDAWQWEDSVALSWRFAYDQQRELSSLYTYADIETRMEKENGIYLQGKLPSKRRSQFRGYECEEI